MQRKWRGTSSQPTIIADVRRSDFLIAEGTPKATVAAVLGKLLRMVTEQWEELINVPIDKGEEVKERSGSPGHDSPSSRAASTKLKSRKAGKPHR